MRSYTWIYAILLLVLSSIILFIVIQLGDIRMTIEDTKVTTSDRSYLSLPIILLSSILFLFGALAILTILYKQSGLSDMNQALGMPKGSVRATLSFLIFVSFLIVTGFFFSSIDNPDDRLSIAKQVVTTLATLLAALSSFYFGSRSSAITEPPINPKRGDNPKNSGTNNNSTGAEYGTGDNHGDDHIFTSDNFDGENEVEDQSFKTQSNNEDEEIFDSSNPLLDTHLNEDKIPEDTQK